MQGKPAQEGEAIQDHGILGNGSDTGLVDLLIQIHAGLVSRTQIDSELQSIDGDIHCLDRLSSQEARQRRQSLKLPRSDLVALVHRLGLKHLLDRFYDVRLVLFHAQRANLKDNHITVLVDDQSG